MSGSSCCCGRKKNIKTNLLPKDSTKETKKQKEEQDDESENSNQESIVPKKSRSISWECLPFSSKKNKLTNKSSKKNKKKNEEEETRQKIEIVKSDKNLSLKVNETNIIKQAISETKKLERSSITPDRSRITNESQKQHQPYTTSLVNSGFGFGFDLHGGDVDNQLTFIINVQPNGDAARKGLQNGDILVSIQGKNVIGIRRVAIERILKQYKVDQEIEIVVCRLKDPSFILNLSNKHQDNSKSSFNTTVESTSNNIITNKYRSLNEQIFNELISFQDSYTINNSKLTASTRSCNSSSTLNSISKASMIKGQELQHETNGAKDMDITDNKQINIEINRNSRLKEQKQITLRSNYNNNNGNNSNNQNRRLNTEHLAVSNSAQYSSDSGYMEPNRQSHYQSDVSILLYDNIGGSSVVGSAGNRLSSSTDRRNSKNDLVVVSVTQQQQTQFYHPQIQPMQSGNYQFVAKNMQPLTLNSVKSMSMSVNDFTGSILAADRVNLQNKQQQQQQHQGKQFETSRRSVSNANDLTNSRTERYNNQTFIYLQQDLINQQQDQNLQREQLNQQQQNNIKTFLTTDNNNILKKSFKNIPSNSKLEQQQFQSYQESIDILNSVEDKNFFDSSNYTDQNFLRNTYKISSSTLNRNNQIDSSNSNLIYESNNNNKKNNNNNSENFCVKTNLAERNFRENKICNSDQESSSLIGVIPTHLKDTINEATLLSSSSTSSTSSTSSSSLLGQLVDSTTTTTTSKKNQVKLSDNNYESNFLEEIPISIPVFETAVTSNNTKPITKYRYKTELTPITSVTSFEITNSASSFDKKSLENISSSGSSSSISSIKQQFDSSINFSSSADIDVFNTSPKKQDQLVIMPRASRKKNKPYQLTCNDPSVSIKQISVLNSESNVSPRVSISLPVDSLTLLSDEDISINDPMNAISNKVNSQLSIDKTDGYSDISIKYIDDNNSAPMSPECRKSLRHSELTDIDASEILDRKSNICLIEINPENRPNEAVDEYDKANESAISVTSPKQVQPTRATKKSKKEKRNRHTIPILSSKVESNNAKITKSQESLNNLSSLSSSEEDIQNKKVPSKSNSFNSNSRREHLKKRQSEKTKSTESLSVNVDSNTQNLESNQVIESNAQSIDVQEEASPITNETLKLTQQMYDEIDEAFKSGGDYSLPESNDEETLLKKKIKSNKLSIFNEPDGISHHVETATKILSGSKSDSENTASNYEKRLSLATTPTNEAARTLGSIKHDSTETLDSASSYEIRFERKPSFSKQKHKLMRDKLAEKNAEWNISVIESVSSETKLDNLAQNFEDLNSPSYNSNSFSCSTEINANLACQNEEKSALSANFESSSAEFSTGQSKAHNESLEMDDLENALTSSSLMASSINDENEMPKSQEQKLTLSTPVLVVQESDGKSSEKILINRIISSLAPSVVFDDGYGSTVSLKQTTNESCSSIDDAEMSFSSNLSNLDAKKMSQMRKISQENKGLSFVKDSIEIEQIEESSTNDIETKSQESIANLDTTTEKLSELERPSLRKLSKILDKGECINSQDDDSSDQNDSDELTPTEHKDTIEQILNTIESSNDLESNNIKNAHFEQNESENNEKDSIQLLDAEVVVDTLNESKSDLSEKVESLNQEQTANDAKDQSEPVSLNDLVNSSQLDKLESNLIENNQSKTVIPIEESIKTDFSMEEFNQQEQYFDESLIQDQEKSNDEYLESSVVTVIEKSKIQDVDSLDLTENLNESSKKSSELSNSEQQLSFEKTDSFESTLNSFNLLDETHSFKSNEESTDRDASNLPKEEFSSSSNFKLDSEIWDESKQIVINQVIEEVCEQIANLNENEEILEKNDDSNEQVHETVQEQINVLTSNEKLIDDTKDSLIVVVNETEKGVSNDLNVDSITCDKNKTDDAEVLKQIQETSQEQPSECRPIVSDLAVHKKLIEDQSNISLEFIQAISQEEDIGQLESNTETLENETKLNLENASTEIKFENVEDLVQEKIDNETCIESNETSIEQENKTENKIENETSLVDNVLQENDDEKNEHNTIAFEIQNQNLQEDLSVELEKERDQCDFLNDQNIEDDLKSTTTDETVKDYTQNQDNVSFEESTSKIQTQDSSVSMKKSNNKYQDETFDYDFDESNLIPPTYYKQEQTKVSDSPKSSDVSKSIKTTITNEKNDNTSNLISESILNLSVNPLSTKASAFTESKNTAQFKNYTSLLPVDTHQVVSPYVSYRSNIAPRNTVISKRGVGIKSQGQYQLNMSKAISIRPTKTTPIIETRDKEKQQLKALNETFASYVERVKFLEASNKKLQIELEALKTRQGSGMKQIMVMYQIELDEAKNVLNDTNKLKNKVESRLNKTEVELESMRQKTIEIENNLAEDKMRIKSLQEQVLTNESEIGLLRRRLSDLHDEEARLKQETIRIMNECNRVSNELENEMKQRLILETDKQVLEEELVFLKEMHVKELQELKKEALKDTGFDPTQYFKNELTNAIRQIREEYEHINLEQRSQLEQWYTCRVTEIKRSHAKPITNIDEYSYEQTRKLKSQLNESKQNVIDIKAKNALLECRIRDIQDEINREEVEHNNLLLDKESEIKFLSDSLMRVKCDYDELIEFKSDLESEIKTYRRLLEGEEDNDGLKQIVETIEKRHKPQQVNHKLSSAVPLSHNEKKIFRQNKELSLQLTGRSTLL